MFETAEFEVDFAKYCKVCTYRDEAEEMDPCHECLSNPTNYNSQKPVKFEPTKGKEKK